MSVWFSNGFFITIFMWKQKSVSFTLSFLPGVHHHRRELWIKFEWSWIGLCQQVISKFNVFWVLPTSTASLLENLVPSLQLYTHSPLPLPGSSKTSNCFTHLHTPHVSPAPPFTPSVTQPPAPLFMTLQVKNQFMKIMARKGGRLQVLTASLSDSWSPAQLSCVGLNLKFGIQYWAHPLTHFNLHSLAREATIPSSSSSIKLFLIWIVVDW